jgi:hypothetical protein
MKSHFALNRGIAAACTVAGASAMLNGNCRGQSFVAADYATNSTYSAGWSGGQNGGFGLGAWSMAFTGGTSDTNVLQNTMDRTSSFDPFGVAWTLYNPQGTVPQAAWGSPFTCANPPTGTDLSRAGRAIPGGLQPGETFSTIISNPLGRTFYKGYTIVFSNGGENIQYGAAGAVLSVGTFEYFSYGQWYAAGANGHNNGYTGTTLHDTDTSANGMQLDVTITGTNSYHIVMTPLGNPAIAFAEDGTFATNGPITWVTYQLYNTDSDFYPSLSACGANPTDFYIKSMTITGLTIQQAGTNVILTWPTNVPSLSLNYATNLNSGAVWAPVSPQPVVINGLNFVTNSVAGTQRYYRLQQ